MGHLGNPTAFRLGIKKNWKFNFFVKNLYYSELFHNLVNVKDFIAYYYTNTINNDIFFSHLRITKILKKIFIDIYIYFLPLEQLSYKLMNELYIYYYEIYNMIKNKYFSDKNYEMISILVCINNSDLGVSYFTYLLFYESLFLWGNEAVNEFVREVKEMEGLDIQLKLKALNEDDKTPSKTDYDYAKKVKENFAWLNKNIQLKKKKKLKVFLEKNKFLKNVNIEKINVNCKVNSNYNYLKFLFYFLKIKWNAKNAVGYLKKKFRFTSYSKYFNTRRYPNWKKWKRLYRKHKKYLKIKKAYALQLYNNKIKKDKAYKAFNAFIKLKKRVKKHTKRLSNLWMGKVYKILLNHKNCKKFKNKINKDIKKLNILEKQWLKAYKKNKLKLHFSYFLYLIERTKVYDVYKDKAMSWLLKNKKHYKNNLRDVALLDKYFSNFLDFSKMFKTEKSYNECKNMQVTKWSLFCLFMCLAQKVGFQKINQMKTLKNKWKIMLFYIKFFYKFNMISKNVYKDLVANILRFVFYMSTYIKHSADRKKFRVKHNFRNAIFRKLYFGLYLLMAYPILEIKTRYLKLVLTLLLNNKFDKNTISIKYYFITNNTVSSQLIAYYIAIRLRKNISIWKSIRPLKFELKRLFGMNKNRSYNIGYMRQYIKRNLLLRRKYLRNWLNKYIYAFYVLMNLIYFKYYKENCSGGLLITLNFFFYNIYHNNDNGKRKFKEKHKWYTKWVHDMLCAQSYLAKYKLRKKSKSFKFIKNYKINLIYPLVLSLNNSKWKLNLYSYNNALYYILKIKYNIFVYKTCKLLNTKWIYIGSFLSKNFMNYGVVKQLWLLFKKFNLRNLRQKQLPKYHKFFRGFKIVIKGRFSRKQRASKVTWKKGKVPLNTGDADIDFCFLTIPITNSAISIKVYMYRSMYKNYKIEADF